MPASSGITLVCQICGRMKSPIPPTFLPLPRCLDLELCEPPKYMLEWEDATGLLDQFEYKIPKGYKLVSGCPGYDLPSKLLE